MVRLCLLLALVSSGIGLTAAGPEPGAIQLAGDVVRTGSPETELEHQGGQSDAYDRPIGSRQDPIEYGPQVDPATPAVSTGPLGAPADDLESTQRPGGLAARGRAIEVTLEWERVVFGTGIGATGMPLADLDHDGVPEIIASASTGGFSANQTWYVLGHNGGEYGMIWVGPLYDASVSAVRAYDVIGDDTPDVVVGVGSRIEVYDGGTRENAATIVTTAERVRGLRVVDVDGDGEDEYVFCDDDDAYVYGVESGLLEWRGNGYGGDDLDVGNVDDDADLEIVIGNGSATGYVLNGVTHGIEWAYPSGFGSFMRVGDIDGDGRDEIVAGYSWHRIVTFDADVTSPKYEIPVDLDLDALQLFDVEGDSRPEIVYGDGQWGDVYVHAGVDGAFLWSIRNPEHGVTDVAVGDTDGDGVQELVWGAGYSSTGEDYLYVADTATHTQEWRSEDIGGPFYALDSGDVDADGETELLYGCFESDSGYGDGLYFIHDGATKALEYASGEPTGSNWTGLWRIRHADLDDDPQAEIVITTGETYSGSLICYDGISHDEQWTASVESGQTYRALDVADVDDDGELELVASTCREHTGATGIYLYVYDAATGAQEWRSISLGTYWGGLNLLRIANVDDDPQLEMLVAEYGGQLFVYDGVGKTEELQTSDRDITALETADLDGDGIAEIIVGVASGQVQVLDPKTGDVVDTIGAYGSQIDGLVFGPLAPNGELGFAYCVADELFIRDIAGLLLWRSGDIGTYTGRNDSLMLADVDDDGDPELTVNTGVRGLRVYQVDVFIPGDVDKDGDVDLSDLAALLASYLWCEGDPAYNPDADLDGSGCVDLSDLAELLSHYGE